MTFPPEPWDLHGHHLVGIWLLPKGVAPPPHSRRTPAIRVFGRTIVAAAWFVYTEPSPLTYGELMATVLVREGARPRVSITHIWVDSEDSRDGGRALWAIPKELATFRGKGPDRYAAFGLGSAVVRRVRMLPFRLPVSFKTAQDRDGELVVSSVKGTVRMGLARADWTFHEGGPLAFLEGRKPLVSLVSRPFHLVFGRGSSS